MQVLLAWHVHITLMFPSSLNLERVSLQDGYDVSLTATTHLSQPLENIYYG